METEKPFPHGMLAELTLRSQETGKELQGTDRLPGQEGWERAGSPLGMPGKVRGKEHSSASELPHPMLHS